MVRCRSAPVVGSLGRFWCELDLVRSRMSRVSAIEAGTFAYGLGPAAINQLLDTWVSRLVSPVDDQEGRGWQVPRAVLDNIPIGQIVSLTRGEKYRQRNVK